MQHAPLTQADRDLVRIAAAEADLPALGALTLPAEIVAVAVEDDRCVFPREGGTLPPEEAYRDIAGFVALSPAGRETIGRARTAWAGMFGTEAPELLDLGGGPSGAEAQRGAVLDWLVTQLARTRTHLARRNVTLTRALSRLRETHEQTQTAFQKLDKLFLDTARGTRLPAGTLPADSRNGIGVLQDGDMVEQRLPCSSEGLSDVAVHLWFGGPAEGTLHAALELVESGETVADWRLRAADLRSGWTRLSLPVALGPDPQTVRLKLVWQGRGDITLTGSVRPADPQFRGQLNSVPQASAMAMKTWKYIPLASTVMPADGHPSSGAPESRKWVIGRGFLEAATPIATDPGNVEFVRDVGGLAVRPASTAISAARLSRACRVGTRRITGSAETKQAAGPNVEYAIAVAPAAAEGDETLPPFAEGWISDWTPLAPSQWSELVLFLPAPLEAASDLYLLTRIARRGKTDTPPEACFFRLVSTT